MNMCFSCKHYNLSYDECELDEHYVSVPDDGCVNWEDKDGSS